MDALRAAILVSAALSSVACSRLGGGGGGACGRVVGEWRGDAVEPQPGRDREAARVVAEVTREERWRVTRVGSSLLRERVGAAGGPPVGELMSVREDGASRCVVDLQTARGSRTYTFTPRGDGRLAVDTPTAWYTALYRPAR